MSEVWSIYSRGEYLSGAVYFWEENGKYYKRGALDRVTRVSKKLYDEAYRLHLEQKGERE